MNEMNLGQFIGADDSAQGREVFQACDPSSGSAFGPEFHEATTGEVERACRLAGESFRAFRDLPLSARADFLDAVATALDAREADFVATTPAESGLPEARVKGELARTTGQLRLFAQVVRAGDFLGARIDTGDSEAGTPDVRLYHAPVGPVGVFAVSNFPLAFSVAGGDTASAFAAGCPVVVKAHPAHPATSALAATAVREAVRGTPGVPEGAFSLVHGTSNEVGGALVRHPAIRAIGFTGSFRGGTALARIAAERPDPIPVYAEMGSVNPMFLFPGALAGDAPGLAEGFAKSMTMACGQFCTKPGLVFVPSGPDSEAFVDNVAKRIAESPAGALLTPGILEAYGKGASRVRAISAVQEVAAGPAADHRAQGRVFRTNLETFKAHPELKDEVFGPLSIVVEVPDVAAMTEAAGLIPGQLTASVHAAADELSEQARFLAELERMAGRVIFGGYPTGVRVCHSMVHGGPYPSTTSYGQTTSVGTLAIERFLRPVCYQDFPQTLLPEPIRNENSLGIRRLVNGEWKR